MGHAFPCVRGCSMVRAKPMNVASN
jgi:hypothetical protein